MKLPEEERAPYRAARGAAEKDRTPEQKALLKKYPSALALYSLDLYDAALQKKVTDRRAEATKLRANKPPEGFVMALTEIKGQVPVTKLFHRGDHDQPKQTVGPGELSVLAQPEVEPFQPATAPSGSSGRRLAYARWLTNGKHPLVARVLVNRFWSHHFGRGIVNTPGDFGVLGERPTHPELLDWLASQFVEGGWKLKPLHRLMVLSSAYRQGSRNDAAMQADPDGRLYARFNLRRLDAEALRDSMIAAAGQLNATHFGAPLPVGRDAVGRVVVGKEEKDANGDVTKVASLGGEDFRRSIYVQARRKMPVTVLETFDAPAMLPNCERRNSTTVAPQSLLLLNDTFVLGTARTMAERLRKDAPGDARAQVTMAWKILFSRAPQENEISRSLAHLAEQGESIRAFHAKQPLVKDAAPVDPALDALASLCQVLCSSNRFLYVE